MKFTPRELVSVAAILALGAIGVVTLLAHGPEGVLWSVLSSLAGVTGYNAGQVGSEVKATRRIP